MEVARNFTSSLKASNTKCVNLTWLPVTLSVLDMINCLMCSHDVMGADFENLPYFFGLSEKLESSIYNNKPYRIMFTKGVYHWVSTDILNQYPL